MDEVQKVRDRTITVEIILPKNSTMGDLITARGSLMDAVTDFIDWDLLRDHEDDAISPPGKILLDIARALKESEKS